LSSPSGEVEKGERRWKGGMAHFVRKDFSGGMRGKTGKSGKVWEVEGWNVGRSSRKPEEVKICGNL
jgi:hypothetical protein